MNRTLLTAAALLTLAGTTFANGIAGGVSPNQAQAAPQATPKVVVAQDIAPQATNLINFDTITAPDLFISTTALVSVGTVQFNGSSTQPLDGGAVLNSSSNFSVTGYSAPNFLAFNCNTTMADGGVPRLPEVIRFASEVSQVSLKIGSGIDVGAKVTMFGIGSQGVEKKVVTLAAALKTIKFSKPLTHVMMSAGACKFVVDDIGFVN
ncbi:MAG: hypothetical protein C4K60_14130 [Ideonella sp. MAG2]|nr:MAG: hypothetical protein C4K60_14130 [Ideonella sp. MAG2]